MCLSKLHLEKTGCPLPRIAPSRLMRSYGGVETSQPDAGLRPTRIDEPKTRMVRQAEGDRCELRRLTNPSGGIEAASESPESRAAPDATRASLANRRSSAVGVATEPLNRLIQSRMYPRACSAISMDASEHAKIQVRETLPFRVSTARPGYSGLHMGMAIPLEHFPQPIPDDEVEPPLGGPSFANRLTLDLSSFRGSEQCFEVGFAIQPVPGPGRPRSQSVVAGLREPGLDNSPRPPLPCSRRVRRWPGAGSSVARVDRLPIVRPSARTPRGLIWMVACDFPYRGHEVQRRGPQGCSGSRPGIPQPAR